MIRCRDIRPELCDFAVHLDLRINWRIGVQCEILFEDGNTQRHGTARLDNLCLFIAKGGIAVKLTVLQRQIKHHPKRCHILYSRRRDVFNSALDGRNRQLPGRFGYIGGHIHRAIQPA